MVDRLAQLFAGTLSVWHMHLAMLDFSGLILKVFLSTMNLHGALLCLMFVFIIGEYFPTTQYPRERAMSSERRRDGVQLPV